VSALPTATIVIPTRQRPAYLDVALASVAPQARTAGAEIVVVNDGGDEATTAVAGRHGARVVAPPPPGGLNAARNAGIDAARADLVVLIDDDVRAPAGWLDAVLTGAASAPEVDVFGGPIYARLEGGGPRSCGREAAPITTLDLGRADRDVPLVWGANMALRRRALDRAGRFDEEWHGPGDEEDWERRYTAAGGVVRYLAGAGLEHRRTAQDATVASLSRAAYRQGRASRRYDVRKGTAPPLMGELRTLAGCQWHVIRRRCLGGIVMGAHAAGRVRETLTRSGPAPGPDASSDFLSGTSGQIHGIRATTRAAVADALCDAAVLASPAQRRLRRAAASAPRRRVLALAVERTDVPNVLAAARAELVRSHHAVDVVTGAVGDRGKFENLNALLETHPAAGYDWLLVLDDDVRLPPGFLDVLVFLAERFDLALAQPAHRWRSHAAWAVTRRRPFSVARQTRFVEIGPVCALRADTFSELLPFPALRFGWGLDAHWSAVAQRHGWRMGVIDALPVDHGLRRIAASYDRGAAVAEARAFLAARPYTTAAEAQRTVVTYRRWR
jgi:GT2 family glycosyltransferase